MATGIDTSGDLKNRLKAKDNAEPVDAETGTSSVKSAVGGESGEKPKRPKKQRKRSRLKVAPLNTPIHRRLQTLGVIWHMVLIPLFCILFLFVLYLGWVAWLCVILPYFVWFYGVDIHTPTNGKVVYRVRDWMRNLIVWEWFVGYFPIRVYKLCELEPTFTHEVVELELAPDDEEDLVSEDSRTAMDIVFKWLGLLKRINDSDRYSPPANASDNESFDEKNPRPVVKKYRRVSTGPRYIFGYHPHGVISMGAMGLFATNALRNEPFQAPVRFLRKLFHDPAKGERVFPGIGYVFPLTLTTQFTIPFFRDYLLSLGLTSASAKNIKSIINNGDNSVCIVVGGAQESLLNDMVGGDLRVGLGYQDTSDLDDDTPKEEPKKQIKLVLRRRKGFVKLAIELGNVSLVPTFGFGEADIYRLSKPKPGSFGYAFQQWMKRTWKFTIPFFSARGVFIYDFGIVPFRTPINIVTGRPIYVPPGLLLDQDEKLEVQSSPEPTKAERLASITNLLNLGKLGLKKKKRVRSQIPPDILNHYHKLYIDELKRVYEEHKNRFGYGDVELIITE